MHGGRGKGGRGGKPSIIWGIMFGKDWWINVKGIYGYRLGVKDLNF